MSDPDENGCRAWLGYFNPRNGYGQLHVSEDEVAEYGFSSRTVTAPVAVASVVHGARPPGMVVCHSCDNRPCVEPRHLRWDTQRANNVEAWARGRQLSGALHHRAKLTDDEIVAAVARVDKGETARDVADEVGVSFSVVAQWARREGRGRVVPTGGAGDGQ